MRDTGCIRLPSFLLPLTRPPSDYYARVKSLAKSCFDRWVLIPLAECFLCFTLNHSFQTNHFSKVEKEEKEEQKTTHPLSLLSLFSLSRCSSLNYGRATTWINNNTVAIRTRCKFVYLTRSEFQRSTSVISSLFRLDEKERERERECNELFTVSIGDEVSHGTSARGKMS